MALGAGERLVVPRGGDKELETTTRGGLGQGSQLRQVRARQGQCKGKERSKERQYKGQCKGRQGQGTKRQRKGKTKERQGRPQDSAKGQWTSEAIGSGFGFVYLFFFLGGSCVLHTLDKTDSDTWQPGVQ